MKKTKLKQCTLVTAVLIVVSTVGCSKKDEECRAAAAAYKTLDKSAFQIDVSLDNKTGGAAIEQVANLINQTEGRVKELKLTDEMLITFQKAFLDHLVDARGLTSEMSKVLPSANKLESQVAEATGAIESAKAALQAECDKKERRRKARRKKRIDCKSIKLVLANHKNDESDIMELTKTAEGLKHLTISTEAVKKLIVPIVDSLEKRRTISEKKRDALKNIARFKTRLPQLSTQNSRLENNLENYCVDN